MEERKQGAIQEVCRKKSIGRSAKMHEARSFNYRKSHLADRSIQMKSSREHDFGGKKLVELFSNEQEIRKNKKKGQIRRSHMASRSVQLKVKLEKVIWPIGQFA